MVKISNDRLKRLILDKAKTSDQDIIIGPRIGEDAAIIKVGGKYLAVHSDPITGSINDVGWLSINVPANDIATRGIMPRWFVLTLIQDELIQRGVSPTIISRAAALIRKTSIVKEALIAAKYASSMHDPTEGGVIQGLIEMASASNTCIDIESDIPVLEETIHVLGALGIDAYRSLSSGMLLIGAPPGSIDSLINELIMTSIPAKLIGKAKACDEPRVSMKGFSIRADSFVEDDLIRVMDKSKKLNYASS